jgi:hypothetical protein
MEGDAVQFAHRIRLAIYVYVKDKKPTAWLTIDIVASNRFLP